MNVVSHYTLGNVYAVLMEYNKSIDSFHEAVNLAAVWKLPVVFVLENNRYAVTTPLNDACCLTKLAERIHATVDRDRAASGVFALFEDHVPNDARARCAGAKSTGA